MLNIMTEIGTMGIAPTANAGIDLQDISAGATFQLDGSASASLDGVIVKYTWVQTAGEPVALDLTDPIRPKVIAPSASTEQTLSFSLTVLADTGLSSTATVKVNIKAGAKGTLTLLPKFHTRITCQIGQKRDTSAPVHCVYQHTDNVFVVEVIGQDLAPIDAMSFDEIEYQLTDSKGRDICVLTVGKGVSIVDSLIVIHIPSSVVNETVRGFHYHQLVAWHNGFKLPPAFHSKVRVVKVFN